MVKLFYITKLSECVEGRESMFKPMIKEIIIQHHDSSTITSQNTMSKITIDPVMRDIFHFTSRVRGIFTRVFFSK